MGVLQIREVGVLQIRIRYRWPFRIMGVAVFLSPLREVGVLQVLRCLADTQSLLIASPRKVFSNGERKTIATMSPLKTEIKSIAIASLGVATCMPEI